MTVHEKITYGAYQRFMERPENEGRIFELIDGKIVEKSYHFMPSVIAGRIILHLGEFLDNEEIGYVTGASGGYIMPNGDVLVPDVAYITKQHLPETPEREAPVAPDLAVEVKSLTERKRFLRNKVELYLRYSTQIVWLIFPEEQIVEVYTAGENSDVQTVTIDGTLDGGSILPGFALKVSDVFADG